jgi:hypothetical protein
MWNLISVRLETVLVLVQDMCMICAKCTIGSEFVLEAPRAGYRANRSFFRAFLEIGIILFIIISCIV